VDSNEIIGKVGVGDYAGNRVQETRGHRTGNGSDEVRESGVRAELHLNRL
jgi:hypothetical protein